MKASKKIMILNGPSLNFLGIREPKIYGVLSYSKLCDYIDNYPDFKNINFTFLQSNIEGELINFLQKAHLENFDAIIFNPGAYTHTSLAIFDAIKSISVPTIEVHLSNIYAREDFRKICITSGACIGQISGFGKFSYILAIKKILEVQ